MKVTRNKMWLRKAEVEEVRTLILKLGRDHRMRAWDRASHEIWTAGSWGYGTGGKVPVWQETIWSEITG